jgi:hypothetical protein
VAAVPAGHATVAAFEGCGFRQVGTLPEHWHQSGRHQDVLVFFARVEDAWRS